MKASVEKLSNPQWQGPNNAFLPQGTSSSIASSKSDSENVYDRIALKRTSITQATLQPLRRLLNSKNIL